MRILGRVLLRLVRAYTHWEAGRIDAQPTFEALHRLALEGMGVGASSDLARNGELRVLDLAATCSPQPVVVDGGANVGAYSKAVLARLGDRVRVFAFEPDRTAYGALSAALAGSPQAHAICAALSDYDGTAILHGPHLGSELASLHARRLDHFPGLAFAPLEEVPTMRLDSFCRRHGLDHLTLLKLDVEGHELAALRGAGDLLTGGRIDVIQFEFGGTDIDSRTFLQDFWYLLMPRYRLYRLLREGLAPLREYRETLELFTFTTFVAIRRELAQHALSRT